MKRLVAIWLFLMLLVALGVPTMAAEQIKLAVLGKSVHPYWSEVELGVKAAAKAYGIDATFFVPPREDIARQVTAMEGFIAQGVKGISFAASDPDALKAVAKKALQEGIPLVTLDTDSPDSGRYIYIGTDNYSAGKEAGEQMVKILNGNGKVAILTGSLTARNSLERIQGFKDAVAKHPGIKIVTIQSDNEDAQKALALAESVLQTYPDLNAIFGVYAYNGPSAASAIKTAGKAGKVHVVCFDTTPDIIKWIKEGVIDATIGQRPYMMGYLSVAVLYNMNKIGVKNTLQMLPKTNIDTGVDVVTRANLEEYKKLLKNLGIPVKW
ncbi:MAG TPA: substrate-binding domain-containing protein [Firmicutes bacterium]|nr:substrate-binding domain-containing protein [Bacillota bacterium]